jgi:hypothetical protein
MQIEDGDGQGMFNTRQRSGYKISIAKLEEMTPEGDQCEDLDAVGKIILKWTKEK